MKQSPGTESKVFSIYAKGFVRAGKRSDLVEDSRQWWISVRPRRPARRGSWSSCGDRGLGPHGPEPGGPRPEQAIQAGSQAEPRRQYRVLQDGLASAGRTRWLAFSVSTLALRTCSVVLLCDRLPPARRWSSARSEHRGRRFGRRARFARRWTASRRTPTASPWRCRARAASRTASPCLRPPPKQLEEVLGFELRLRSRSTSTSLVLGLSVLRRDS